MAYILAPSALNDVADIIDVIKQDNPRAAEKWFANIIEKCALLAQFPRMGVKKDDTREGIYYFPCDNYLIFYDIIKTDVTIVHVIHGARNILELFQVEEGKQ